MALDGGRRALEADTLDDIGVERTLGKPLVVGGELLGFLLKKINEFVADNLALAFRIGDVVERVEKTVGGLDVAQIEFKRVLKYRDDLLGFILAE